MLYLGSLPPSLLDMPKSNYTIIERCSAHTVAYIQKFINQCQSISAGLSKGETSFMTEITCNGDQGGQSDTHDGGEEGEGTKLGR